MKSVQQSILFSLLFIAGSVLAKEPSPFSYQQINKDGLVITGTVRFTEQVSQCLDLLADKVPERYQFIKKHIGEIKLHKKSGMVAAAIPPRYEMSTKTAFYSLTWCASSIAHDAYHSYLYQLHKPKDGRSTPAIFWSGFKAEAKAIHYQRETAKRIGASNTEINYLYNIKGTHSDLDGDRVITSKDLNKRDW